MVSVVLLWARVLVVFLKGGGWVFWGLCLRTCGVAGLFSSAEGDDDQGTSVCCQSIT